MGTIVLGTHFTEYAKLDNFHLKDLVGKDIFYALDSTHGDVYVKNNKYYIVWEDTPTTPEELDDRYMRDVFKDCYIT